LIPETNSLGRLIEKGMVKKGVGEGGGWERTPELLLVLDTRNFNL